MIVDVQTILLWAILIGGLVYETTMWIYRKISEGEQFSLEKYALTYGYVALLAVVAYYTTGFIPGVGDIMVNLTNLPNAGALLPAIMAVIFGIFQQGSKVVSAKKQAVVPVVSPIPPTSTSGGKVTVAGIYGGSAAGDTPQKQLSFDINQIPNLFFDLIGVETGQFSIKMAIDGIIQKKWVPDNQSNTGNFVGKVTAVGERLPFGFYLWNAAVPGTHIITISTGQFDNTGKNPSWFTSDNFSITLTGTKLPE